MELINIQITRLSEARESKRVILDQAVEYGNDPEAPINLDMTEHEIYEATYKASIDSETHLTNYYKTEHDNAWRTYRERTSRLKKQQRQDFSMVRGKCMQVLIEKINIIQIGTMQVCPTTPFRYLR